MLSERADQILQLMSGFKVGASDSRPRAASPLPTPTGPRPATPPAKTAARTTMPPPSTPAPVAASVGDARVPASKGDDEGFIEF
jgi:hypothetical protein